MVREKGLVSILVNLLIPFVVLSNFSGKEHLGPYFGMAVAVTFPIVYGIYFIFLNKEIKPMSLLGLISVVLTGLIGLIAVSPIWIAIKEALIPAVLGIAVIIFMHTKRSLIREFIFNDSIFNTSLIEKSVKKKGKEDELNKLLRNSSYMLAGSFFVSAVLNFVLGIFIVKSLPGTEEFNQEIGLMTLLSFPLIVVPLIVFIVIIIVYLVSGIMGLSEMSFDQVFEKKEK